MLTRFVGHSARHQDKQAATIQGSRAGGRSQANGSDREPRHQAAVFKGNRMDPVVPNGTCVGVDTGDTAVRDGETYAIDHDGML
jgi:phage repressor protein C with HTH and peptisase S24 domain